jgi:predicted ABC-type ATPase
MLGVGMPKVVVIAGPNGAGKSTVAPAVLRNALLVNEFVNADTIAAGLSAFSPENVAVTAGRVMLERIRKLARERRDFAVETTLASRTFAPWLRKLQSGGYRLHLVYLWLPAVELAAARVAERVRRGGHAIPEDIVRRRYERSLINFFGTYGGLADSWLMVNNSVWPRPHLVAGRAIGRCTSVFKADEWCALRRNMSDEVQTKATLEAESVADELLQERIVSAIGDAVQEAIRDHKRAGNPIAEWRDGRVVLVPPEQIED